MYLYEGQWEQVHYISPLCYNILLAANDVGLLQDIKKFLSKNFEIKDMSEAFYVIGIEIFHDKSQGLLGLSPRTYIEKVLERFRMERCST